MRSSLFSPAGAPKPRPRSSSPPRGPPPPRCANAKETDPAESATRSKIRTNMHAMLSRVFRCFGSDEGAAGTGGAPGDWAISLENRSRQAYIEIGPRKGRPFYGNAGISPLGRRRTHYCERTAGVGTQPAVGGDPPHRSSRLSRGTSASAGRRGAVAGDFSTQLTGSAGLKWPLADDSAFVSTF